MNGHAWIHLQELRRAVRNRIQAKIQNETGKRTNDHYLSNRTHRLLGHRNSWDFCNTVKLQVMRAGSQNSGKIDMRKYNVSKWEWLYMYCKRLSDKICFIFHKCRCYVFLFTNIWMNTQNQNQMLMYCQVLGRSKTKITPHPRPIHNESWHIVLRYMICGRFGPLLCSVFV